MRGKRDLSSVRSHAEKMGFRGCLWGPGEVHFTEQCSLEEVLQVYYHRRSVRIFMVFVNLPKVEMMKSPHFTIPPILWWLLCVYTVYPRRWMFHGSSGFRGKAGAHTSCGKPSI